MSRSNKNNIFQNIVKRREFGVFIILLIIIGIITIKAPRFFSVDNWKDIGLQASILLIIALGEATTMVTGGIDLSVGSILALSAMSVGIMMIRFPNLNVFILVLFGIVVGLISGLINGFIIAKSKINPLIITLGALSIYRGLVVIIGGKGWIVSSDITPSFQKIARGSFMGINNLVLIAAIIFIIFYYFLGYTRLGREIYAYGGNKEAAKFVGISSNQINYIIYAISGALAGLCGSLTLSRILTTTANTAKGYEMLAIAACVIGGISIAGGVGSVIGVTLGTLILVVILSGLELIGISSFWKDAVEGLIILIAIIFDALLSKRMDENLRRSRRIFN